MKFPRQDASSKTYPEGDKTAIKTLGCKRAKLQSFGKHQIFTLPPKTLLPTTPIGVYEHFKKRGVFVGLSSSYHLPS